MKNKKKNFSDEKYLARIKRKVEKMKKKKKKMKRMRVKIIRVKIYHFIRSNEIKKNRKYSSTQWYNDNNENHFALFDFSFALFF